eukprot:TRINITY_DN1551_c0_g1_i3.p1 TRINITY_DN1551_c0_g1~~TRINITY_DN1551_c0_g1_i3.p1  ORF type:complete len:504 (+),score=142.90 TRINITY_DN1551_c0_g1_i3:47-1558(+)
MEGGGVRGRTANPLFVSFLEKLEREARARGNLKLALAYQKALFSLSLYPLPLRSGQEAENLEGIGKFISQKLDQLLEKAKRKRLEDPNTQTSTEKDPKTAKNSQIEHLPRVTSIPVQPATEATQIGAAQPKITPGRPEDYELVMLIDNREEKNNQIMLAEHMTKNGINCEIRQLEVGDIMWIWKRKANNHVNKINSASSIESNLLEKSSTSKEGSTKGKRTTKQQKLEEKEREAILKYADEYVVSYILERKEINDLSGSIIDGRYREQKFRLMRAGLETIIYLIEGQVAAEGTNPRDTGGVKEEALEGACVNTQIRDNMFVIQTKNFHDSVDYLVSLTKQIEAIEIQKNKTLLSNHKKGNKSKRNLDMYNSDDHDGDGDGDDDDDDETEEEVEDQQCVTAPHPFPACQKTFLDFMREAKKTSQLTLRDLFAKQLLQIKGCSASRVAAIVQEHPTPLSLFNAFDEIDDESGREQMIKDWYFFADSVSQRKMGKVFSAKFYSHFK